MGIPYRLHIACIYAYASTFDVKNLLTDAYMANMCNPYGKRICVHTIWASYDNAIDLRVTGHLRRFLSGRIGSG